MMAGNGIVVQLQEIQILPPWNLTYLFLRGAKQSWKVPVLQADYNKVVSLNFTLVQSRLSLTFMSEITISQLQKFCPMKIVVHFKTWYSYQNFLDLCVVILLTNISGFCLFILKLAKALTSFIFITSSIILLGSCRIKTKTSRKALNFHVSFFNLQNYCFLIVSNISSQIFQNQSKKINKINLFQSHMTQSNLH